MSQQQPKRSADRTLLTLALLVAVIALPFLLLCNQPAPAPVLLPTPTLAPIAATPLPTLTTVIAGPPSLHIAATYRPTPTAFVVVPTVIPSLTPVPTATSTPDVLPVLTVLPTVTPMLRPPPPAGGQHVVAPAQLPRRTP